MTPLFTPTQGRETAIADILKGPHIKRQINGHLTEVEGLQFFRCYWHPRIRKAKISRRNAA